jgi:hypothetical protein
MTNSMIDDLELQDRDAPFVNVIPFGEGCDPAEVTLAHSSSFCPLLQSDSGLSDAKKKDGK